MWTPSILLVSSLIPNLWSGTSANDLGSRSHEPRRDFNTRPDLWKGGRAGRCEQTTQKYTICLKVCLFTQPLHPSSKSNFQFYSKSNNQFCSKIDFQFCSKIDFQFCSTSWDFPTRSATLEMELREFATLGRSALRRLWSLCWKNIMTMIIIIIFMTMIKFFQGGTSAAPCAAGFGVCCLCQDSSFTLSSSSWSSS